MAKALSRAGFEALSLAAGNGGLILLRTWSEGYWTYRGCPGERRVGCDAWRPDTTFTRPTLRSLVAAGYLVPDGADALAVTEPGRVALERTRASLDRAAYDANAAIPVDFDLAARVFWRDGGISYAGVVRAGERWRDGDSDDGLTVDPLLTATEEEALGQTRGIRMERSADAPQPPLASSSLDLYWPTPDRTVWVGNDCVLVPYDGMEPVVVEVAWTPGTWDESIWGEVGAVWWVALADRSLGLLCDGIDHAEQSIPARAGLFRPRPGHPNAVTGGEWGEIPLGDLCPVDIPDEWLEQAAERVASDPCQATTKALALAGEGTLVRWQGGFWTYEGCPPLDRTPSMPLPVPSRFVDGGRIAACMALGLLEACGPDDSGATLTEAGRDALELAGHPAPRPGGP